MLLQDQAVNYALLSAGQILVKPDRMFLNHDLIEEHIFKPAVIEYERVRPNVERREVNVGVGGVRTPSDGTSFKTIKRRSLTLSQTGNAFFYQDVPPVEIQWSPSFDFATMIPGAYSIDYYSKNTFGSKVPWGAYYFPMDSEEDILINLPARARTDSVEVVRGVEHPEIFLMQLDKDNIVKEVGGKFSGGFVQEGRVTEDRMQVHLKLVVEEGDERPIWLRFWSKNVGWVQGDIRDTIFFKLFTARFLPAYAAVKSNLVMEGVSFEIDRERCLEIANRMAQEWREESSLNTEWWKF